MTKNRIMKIKWLCKMQLENKKQLSTEQEWALNTIICECDNTIHCINRKFKCKNNIFEYIKYYESLK